MSRTPLETFVLSQYVVYRITELSLPTLRLLLTETKHDDERAVKVAAAIDILEASSPDRPVGSVPQFDWKYGGASPRHSSRDDVIPHPDSDEDDIPQPEDYLEDPR